MLPTSCSSILALQDGAKIAYEILGARHLGFCQPLVLIGGMSSRRIDWERLANSLAEVRPILLYDHRGMGDSELTPSKDENITIELLARDLLQLLTYLRWKDLSLCGFSMGGTISQQLLFLPHHPTRPMDLPFTVTHVVLAGTLCSPLRDPRYGLRIVNRKEPNIRLTAEERLDIAVGTLKLTFDPEWLENPANAARFQSMLQRMVSGKRPMSVIAKQGRALHTLDFEGCHEMLSRKIQFLVIHGELDKVVPFYCGEEILRRIPWSRLVEIGTQPGKVESYAFGHNWFEYFDIQIWHNVVETFLANKHTVVARM